MIPPVTQRPCTLVFTNAVSQSPSFESLKSLGLFDDHYNLLFTPSHIPPISEKGQGRWNKLLDRDICNVKQSDYIGGLAKTLAEKGIEIQTYLRGGYAAYVACVEDYFEFLIQEFLAFKGIDPFEIEVQSSEEPHDVDLFDYVINNGIPATATHDYGLEFLKGLFKEKIPLLQKLIPETSPLFPYPEDYVLFTVGDGDFQTDRIIGRLNHPYLFTRDDIRIEIKDNKICMPESTGNFWQMVLHRSLKVVKTEPWHEKDFRAGLAALQLMQDGHILITDACPLENIFRYAVSTGSDKIYSGAMTRAKLHCKKNSGFLLSAFIAYSHADPCANMQIESPPLPSLYKLALLSTCYNTSYTAYWESGFLVLRWNGQKIIFPKDFAPTSSDDPFFEIGKWTLISCSETRPLCRVLDRELSLLERVLFELALQKRLTPLSESMKDALVDYLLLDGRVNIAHLFHPWIQVENTPLSWIKALITYSFKHGLKLWNGLNRPKLEEVFGLIAWHYPSYSYNIIETERIKLLKLIAKSPKLNPDLAKKIADELIALDNPAHFLTIDFLITEEHEEWFFNSTPTQERIEAVYLRTKNLNFLIRGITLPLLEKFRTAIKPLPETYIKFIKQFGSETLAKEWIHDFPLTERPNQAVLFFTDYTEKDRPLLDAVCSLPGLNEKTLMEKLHLLGRPVFAGQPFSKLFNFLKSYPFDVVKNLGPLNPKEQSTLLQWMKGNLPLSLDLVPCLLENHLPLAQAHLISLKTTHDSRCASLWLTVLNLSPFSSELIPFYQDREWVQAVYGSDAETKTKEWGEALIKRGNLEKGEMTAIENMLSRSTLLHTPRDRVKDFLESLYHKKLADDVVEAYLKKTISTLVTEIPLDDTLHPHHLQLLFSLIKLGIGSKLLTYDALNSFQGLFKCIPYIYQNEELFSPMIHFLETLPLVDYDSETFYQEENSIRDRFFLEWAKSFEQLDVYEKSLKDRIIPSLPYPSMKITCDYAHRFTLITGRYIESKATKDEFQIEVKALSKSVSQADPCLICIQNLSYLLKYKNRKRAYEAFNYLLKQQPASPSIASQQTYLEIRKKTEEFIISKTEQLESFKIITPQFIHAFEHYIEPLFTSNKLQRLHIQDPILDALELESISHFNKIELIEAYRLMLGLYSKIDYKPYVQERVKGFSTFEIGQVNRKDLESYLYSRIDSLKKAKKLHPDFRDKEIDYIIRCAESHLPKENVGKLVKYLEKTLSINISYNYTPT